jgi:hypothetical protein
MGGQPSTVNARTTDGLKAYATYFNFPLKEQAQTKPLQHESFYTFDSAGSDA